MLSLDPSDPSVIVIHRHIATILPHTYISEAFSFTPHIAKDKRKCFLFGFVLGKVVATMVRCEPSGWVPSLEAGRGVKFTRSLVDLLLRTSIAATVQTSKVDPYFSRKHDFSPYFTLKCLRRCNMYCWSLSDPASLKFAKLLFAENSSFLILRRFF